LTLGVFAQGNAVGLDRLAVVDQLQLMGGFEDQDFLDRLPCRVCRVEADDSVANDRQNRASNQRIKTISLGRRFAG
jgi:hypothetical protein